MTREQLRQKCEGLGLPRVVYLESTMFEGAFAVPADPDFDGRFQAMDLETEQLGFVNGWNWILHDDDATRAELAREWWA